MYHAFATLTLLSAALAGPGPRRPHHAPAPAPRVVEVTAHEYAFSLPDTLPAGPTTFRFTNHGTELHHMVLVRLDGGRTLSEFGPALGAAMQPGGTLPDWIHFVGGPNAPAPKGGTANATLDLVPGSYAVVCLIPDAKGVPHIAKGMVRPLAVVAPPVRPAAAGPAAAVLPKATVTMDLLDYGFRLAQPLLAGRQVIRVRNAGPQIHEIELMRLAPGKTLADFAKAGEAGLGTIVFPVGGIGPMSEGAEAQFAADLAPGQYVLICFIPDAQDGKAHFEHGMAQQVEVKAGR
jgi:hypothetical protein